MTVEQQTDDTWTATCDKDGVDGHRCGGFTSTNHPTKKAARDRLDEHLEEA